MFYVLMIVEIKGVWGCGLVLIEKFEEEVEILRIVGVGFL